MRIPSIPARAATLLLAALALTACSEQKLPVLEAIQVTAPEPASEAGRIQAHLGTVLEELRAADVSGLGPAERALRQGHIETLAAYRDAGRFPINTVEPDRSTPVFQDELGTWCAMGYLMASSGSESAASRIARTRNTAFIHELVDDAEIQGWLRANGISAEEAGRIQPTYGPCCYPIVDHGPSSGYAALGTLSAALSGGGIMVNLPGTANAASSGWRGSYGLLAGTLSLGVGLAGLDGGDASTAIGVTNIGIGAASAALGFRTLLGRDREQSAASSTWTAGPVARADEAGDLRPGAAVTVRF